MTQRALEIGACGTFEAGELPREEDSRPLEEGSKDPGPALPPLGVGAEGILLADLALVAVEFLGGRAQDGEIRVHDVLRVGILGGADVPSGHDEGRDALGQAGRDAAPFEDASGICRASRLVVPGARIVDEVVEPQRELSRIGVSHVGPSAVEELQRVGEVLERVVVTLGLRVRAEDLLVKGARVGVPAEPPPQRAPRLEREPAGHHLEVKRSKADSALLDLRGGRT